MRRSFKVFISRHLDSGDSFDKWKEVEGGAGLMQASAMTAGAAPYDNIFALAGRFIWIFPAPSRRN